eukprot:gene34106-40149_t
MRAVLAVLLAVPAAARNYKQWEKDYGAARGKAAPHTTVTRFASSEWC